MNNPDDQACATCRFFLVVDDLNPEEGICRRFPPTVTYSQGAEGDARLGRVTLRPVVVASQWCGEWAKSHPNEGL